MDLIGHDIIGLGFDICGSQRDGIFVRSVFSRGPARESGCIQPGDRIKCLNINLESVTLQDACDILNCASPYQMRLLVEKRPQAAFRSLAATSPSLRPETGGPISATKSYLKRMTQRRPPKGSEHAQLDHIEGALGLSHAPLGSLAARRSTKGRNFGAGAISGHVNEAFGSDHDDELDVESPAELSSGRLKGNSSGWTGTDQEDLETYEQGHHRLRGPHLGAEHATDLRQASEAIETGRGSSQTLNKRQQTAAAVKQLKHPAGDRHLEQSQSQPEIAIATSTTNARLDRRNEEQLGDQRRDDMRFSHSVSSPNVNLLTKSSLRRKALDRSSIREEPEAAGKENKASSGSGRTG